MFPKIFNIYSWGGFSILKSAIYNCYDNLIKKSSQSLNFMGSGRSFRIETLRIIASAFASQNFKDTQYLSYCKCGNFLCLGLK